MYVTPIDTTRGSDTHSLAMDAWRAVFYSDRVPREATLTRVTRDYDDGKHVGHSFAVRFPGETPSGTSLGCIIVRARVHGLSIETVETYGRGQTGIGLECRFTADGMASLLASRRLL